jgi:hypothetical protein
MSKCLQRNYWFLVDILKPMTGKLPLIAVGRTDKTPYDCQKKKLGFLKTAIQMELGLQQSKVYSSRFPTLQTILHLVCILCVS